MKVAEYFNNGFSCSESIIKWGIDEGFVSPELLPAASAFSGGMGAGCLCGAAAASQMIIGSLYGKNNKYGNEVIARAKANEFLQKFTGIHKAACCRILTRGMDMVSPERKAHCVCMVNDCEKLIKEIIKVKV